MVNLSYRGLGAYKDAEKMVDTEDRQRLLLKAYEGILEKLEAAKRAIEKRDYETKFTELSKVIQILEILDASLDRTYGKIAENLSALYAYIIKTLRGVHTNMDIKRVEECKSLISDIFEGFKKAYEIEQKRDDKQRVASREQRIVV